MAMNLGMKTTKLYLLSESRDFCPTNDQYSNGFGPTGTWVDAADPPMESDYLDLGIVIDEREEMASGGGIPISLPFTGADDRLYWAIGGKIMRVTISGIIPDGIYVCSSGDPTELSIYNGKSNSSVFRYKLTKFLAYQNLANNFANAARLHVVRYRRKYMLENNDHVTLINLRNWSIPCWVITGWSLGFEPGTRNLRYSFTLDMSNNIGANMDSYLSPRSFGDIQ